MIYGSVCSGIEAATVAWKELGWEPKWFSEVEPFCNSVLSSRHPSIKNMGDMNGITEEHGPIDLLVGGTPCQSFSVNGLRLGLDDARGNLTLTYIRILGILRPQWFVWENVPGVLSADGGKAFGTFLWMLAQWGYGFAWRVLDCRYFGIPQRRRRLFVVGRCGGQWQKAGAVLFDARGCTQDARTPQKIREASAKRSRDSLRIVGWTGDPTPKFGFGISPTLRAEQGGEGAGFATGGYVARFTPREWERLQGFPDDYTLVEHKGKPAGDTNRKRALGNSFPVPILRWIGERIKFVGEYS